MQADCKYHVFRTGREAAGHHHSCTNHDDNDWQQFVSYLEDTEFYEITPPTEPQEADRAPLPPIDPAIFERYNPLTV